MADVTIPALTEVTDPDMDDEVVLETGAGTRRIQLGNMVPTLSDFGSDQTFAIIPPDNINLPNDHIWFSDATTGKLAAIRIQDIIFGNYFNIGITDAFTLDPTLHNLRPLECSGTFQAATITLDGNVPDQGACSYFIINRTTEDLTLSATNVTLHVDGAVVTSAIIRENTTASVILSNGGTEAFLSGG